MGDLLWATGSRAISSAGRLLCGGRSICYEPRMLSKLRTLWVERVVVLMASRWLRFWLGVLVILVGSLALRVNYANRALPYCHHIDEDTWTKRSVAMLQTSDLNPHRFTKPSLMVYLNTAGTALGLLRAGAHGEALYQPKDLAPGGYPYYSSRTAISTVRSIYAILSVLSMLLGALCVRKLARSDGVALLTLVLMAVSGQYFFYSWKYLNVDILGVFFAMSAIAYAVLHSRLTPPLVVALVSGLLCGFTVGTKYNLFWIAVPMLIQILSASKQWRVERSVLFLLCLVVGFIVTTPYAIFDLTTFVNDAAGEARHYAVGHKQRTVQAGLPMFGANLGHLAEHTSPLLLLIALFGLTRVLIQRPLLSSILFSYPLLLLVYMSSQRTFFPRNILIWHLVIPMAAALGLREVFAWAKAHWVRRAPTTNPNRLGILTACLIALPVLLTTPWSQAMEPFDRQVESRNEAVDWIMTHLPAGTQLVVPTQLNMDVRALSRRYPVHTYDGATAKLKSLKRRHAGAVVFLPFYRQKQYQLKATEDAILATFGKRPLNLEYRTGLDEFIASGNPHFSLVRL